MTSKIKSRKIWSYYENSDFTQYQGCFRENVLAYAANGGGKSEFGLIAMGSLDIFATYSSNNRLRVKADDAGVYLWEGNLLICMDVDAGEQEEIAKLEKENITDFSVYKNSCVLTADDGSIHVFDAAKEQAAFADENIAHRSVLTDKQAVVDTVDEVETVDGHKFKFSADFSGKTGIITQMVL